MARVGSSGWVAAHLLPRRDPWLLPCERSAGHPWHRTVLSPPRIVAGERRCRVGRRGVPWGCAWCGFW